MNEEATLEKIVDGEVSDSEGWMVRSLGELAEYQNGNAFSKSEWGDKGYPIIRIQNLTGEQDEFNYFDGDLKERYEVEAGDTLLSWSATIDVFQWSGPKAALNQHIFRVDTSEEVNDTFYRFELEHLLPRLIALSHGSTMQHVRKADLVNIDANIPPLSEQRKIATVLYTVDRAIEKKEAIVDNLERIHKGLFQSLIPSGIGHEQYDEVRILGRNVQIPASWDVTTVSEACSDIIDYRGKNPEFSDEGIPHLRNINIGRGELLLDDLKYVSGETYDEWMTRGFPQKGDTLLSTEAPMGKTAVLPEMKFSLSQRLIVLRSGEQFDNQFFAHLMGSPFVQKEYDARATGSTVKGISNYNLQEVTIPVPPREEQEEITKRIDDTLEAININEQEIDRLKRLKRGLMQDLFSGKVRTTDTNIEVPEEVAQHG